MKWRSLEDRVYKRTNKNDGWFHSKKGYSIRFNWFRNGFDWLMGEFGYNLNDWTHKIQFNKDIWYYIRMYPARVIARTKGKYGIDLAFDDFDTLLNFFVESGLIQIEGGEVWELPDYQQNNIIMFIELVKDYFYLNQDMG